MKKFDKDSKNITVNIFKLKTKIIYKEKTTMRRRGNIYRGIRRMKIQYYISREIASKSSHTI